MAGTSVAIVVDLADDSSFLTGGHDLPPPIRPIFTCPSMITPESHHRDFNTVKKFKKASIFTDGHLEGRRNPI
jgi:hypothetical protein